MTTDDKHNIKDWRRYDKTWVIGTQKEKSPNRWRIHRLPVLETHSHYGPEFFSVSLRPDTVWILCDSPYREIDPFISRTPPHTDWWFFSMLFQNFPNSHSMTWFERYLNRIKFLDCVTTVIISHACVFGFSLCELFLVQLFISHRLVLHQFLVGRLCRWQRPQASI